VGFSYRVVWHLNFGIDELKFTELVNGVVNGVGWIGAVVGVSVGRLGPGYPFEVGCRVRVEVVLGNPGQEGPRVFRVKVIKGIIEIEIDVIKLVGGVRWLVRDICEWERLWWKVVWDPTNSG
jgi:hypothetical protein